ncbi:MAG: RNA methyltransferase [Bacteroidota bacterium]|nr:RNA methyltransferase [Bacteroidota bacterium]MDP3144430.1 RNA methyltransferase [Bacteroidota bacterium]MDP3555892.1 RNA methyltransferase [Bacteroidota bacterium]
MLSKNQIKEIQSLHLKKQRDSHKLFIVEGIKSVAEVLSQEPSIISKIYATKDFILNNSIQLEQNKISCEEITETDLQKISLQNNPNQVLGICNYFIDSEEEVDFQKEFSFFLDDIRDPGNFGTIIRLADWYGVTTVYCSPASCDFYNPKVIQATMGAFMRIRVVYCELNELLKKQKVEYIYGAVLTGENIYDEKLKNGLVIIGNEANGISDANLKLINKPITIPSHRTNGTESLNAAMATAIITSEFFRQLKN